MSDGDVFDRIEKLYGLASMRRREPALRAILARYPSFHDVAEVRVTQQEYDVLLDGEELPKGTRMTVMGLPVVVPNQEAA